MGKVHKDIAMFMMEATKDENSTDQAFIKVSLISTYIPPHPTPPHPKSTEENILYDFQELSNKTKDLIGNLKKLAVESEEGSEPKITLEGLQQRKLTTIMENFLFNLAAAEGMVWE